VHVVRKDHRGAYRTALGYVLVVMAGTFLLVLPMFTLLASEPDRLHAYAHPSLLAVLGFHAKLLLRLVGSFLVVLWLFAGVFIYVCALLLQKLKIPLLSRLILAAVSAYLSCKIVFILAPTGWPSLAAVYFTMLCVGLLGAAYGFFVYPWICRQSFQTAPLGRGHRVLLSAWGLYVVSAYGYTAFAISKVRFLNDPSIDLVLFKWSPGEGEVQEEPMGKFDTQFPQMRDLEIQELRAAGLTGILRCWGNNTLPGSSRRIRVVLVMSRGLRESIDLPKPASADILYIQTQEGWKAFPASTTTVKRTIRLSISEPNVHHTDPYTNVTTDTGLGYPDPESGVPTFYWLPEEFQSPLPSLPTQTPSPN
jgi:hypothetical protein